MSIILKGNNISSNNNGIGPGEVTNIKASQNASSIILSWANPSNVVIDGTTLSIFDHVIIVRNESRYPTSIKDGNTIYSGNGTTCSDSDVIKNKKYYYRFFVYDTNKLCNNNMSMIIENTFYGIDPILKNNTWEQINAASEAGIASSLWKVGDEIDITLSGTFNETVTLQIWDFKHFDKSDGSGKAGIVFGMKNLMKDVQYMNSSHTNSGGWNNTAMKKTVMANIYNSIPSDLQSYIKEVNTYANQGLGSSSSSTGLLSKDKVFLPGMTEMFGKNYKPDQSETEKNQKKFPIFTNDNSRIKKLSNGSGDAYQWWLRSAIYGNNSDCFCDVTIYGTHDYTGASYGYGVCFCFNV
jgi:hypothetical protein